MLHHQRRDQESKRLELNRVDFKSTNSKMLDPWLCKTLNPTLFLLTPFPNNPLRQTLTFKPLNPNKPSAVKAQISRQIPRDLRAFAGRSKKKAGGESSSSGDGRIDANSEFRKESKRNARRKTKKLAESMFYRLKNPTRNYPDNFTQEELQQIGLGYDRMVRFMDKDDPNLRDPADWYKYGEFGPYSWKGVVVGDPVRGRFTDERVTIMSDVRDEEEWDKIEQFEMCQDYGKRLTQLDNKIGVRYYWVFVRHPKWRLSELPWEQWTLVSELAVEAGREKRLDKWSLMGRLGNLTRSLITKCAAWMRPDILYVKRPVYQCRFEPQDGFFDALVPFLDPKTEQDYMFKLEREDGSGGEMCTYYGGLCKIVKVSQKAYVDDVVKGYEKLSDGEKSRCLGFLLKNHPVKLLHPYTREWKAKLEEWELGCDAPDSDDADLPINKAEKEFTDWVEVEDEDGNEGEEEDDSGEESDVVIDMEAGEDDVLGVKDEDASEEEDEKYWEDEFKKAATSAEAMEKLAKRSVEITDKYYKKQLREMEGNEGGNSVEDGDETAMRGRRPKTSEEEWKLAGYGPWKKRIKKSRIPPQLFLRAAVNFYTYTNLVKEIVLTRHAILDGDFPRKASQN